MKAFAHLLERLAFTPARNAKLLICGIIWKPRRIPIAATRWLR